MKGLEEGKGRRIGGGGGGGEEGDYTTSIKGQVRCAIDR